MHYAIKTIKITKMIKTSYLATSVTTYFWRILGISKSFAQLSEVQGQNIFLKQYKSVLFPNFGIR